MLTAQVESFEANYQEMSDLWYQHWRKLALDQDKVPLDPRFEIYIDRERAGELCFLTLRDVGKIVGYWISFVQPGLHYKTCLTAMMDIWNVNPEYEKTMAPLVLMRAVEKEYKRRGVNRSHVGEKLHRPYGRLLKAFGYEPIETYHCKWITEMR